MSTYQYRVVPAPTKGVKAKGIKGPEARFSHTIEELMNQMGSEGWEYQRAETLPSVERTGLTGSTTEWRNILVFRKPREDTIDAFTPERLEPPIAAPIMVDSTSNEAPQSDEIETAETPHRASDEEAEMSSSLQSLADRRSSFSSDS